MAITTANLMTIFEFCNCKIVFADGFGNFKQSELEDILEKMKNKYTDFNEVITRNYTAMYNAFVESDKHKMYLSMDNTDPTIYFNYPEKTDDGRYRFVAILNVKGKGRKRYYASMGKFNVPINNSYSN